MNATVATWPMTYSVTASDGTATAATVWPKFYAPMFQLNFRQVDLPAASTGSRATSGQATQTSGSGRPSSNPDSQSGVGGGSGGLSAGAKAGIGVGVAVGALFVLGIAAFLLYRRRAAKKAQTGGSYDYDYAAVQPKTSEGHPELMGDTGASEMATNSPLVELPASRP